MVRFAFAAAVLALAAPAHALFAAEAASLGAASSFEPVVGPALSAVGARPLALRPVQGTVTGGTGGAPVSLSYDRRAWTVKGGVNGAPVDLFIDHEASTIKGGANGSPVDLHFYWSTERIITRGGANLSQVDLLLDWGSKTLTGTANSSPVRISFDLEAGTVKGHANHAPVDLKHDAVSGRVTGSLNARPVDFTLTNLDLTDLLPHFFLFLK